MFFGLVYSLQDIKDLHNVLSREFFQLSYHHPNSITRSQNTKHIFPSFINVFLCYTMLDPVLLKSTNVRSRIWIKTFNISIDTAISFIIYHKEEFCFYYTPTILCWSFYQVKGVYEINRFFKVSKYIVKEHYRHYYRRIFKCVLQSDSVFLSCYLSFPIRSNWNCVWSSILLVVSKPTNFNITIVTGDDNKNRI